jgi:hypothetical protein
MQDAHEVVKWFNNHSRALGLLDQEQQKPDPRTGIFRRVLALVLPVITRWTSHYLAACRLLQLEGTLRAIGWNRQEELREIAGRGEAAQAAVEKVIHTITTDCFWADLARCVIAHARIQSLLLIQMYRARIHLEPLAIAANVTQADSARLDSVLLTLGNLFFVYRNGDFDPDVRDTILRSLEKRWSQADQPIFILSLILNPYLRQSCFARNSPFQQFVTVWEMAEKAYTRMFGKPPPLAMRGEFAKYWSHEGVYSHARWGLEAARADALRQVSLVKCSTVIGVLSSRFGYIEM